jgi:hypothetical protein
MTTENIRVPNFTAGLSSGLLGRTGKCRLETNGRLSLCHEDIRKWRFVFFTLALDGDDWSASCPSWKYKL